MAVVVVALFSCCIRGAWAAQGVFLFCVGGGGAGGGASPPPIRLRHSDEFIHRNHSRHCYSAFICRDRKRLFFLFYQVPCIKWLEFPLRNENTM